MIQSTLFPGVKDNEHVICADSEKQEYRKNVNEVEIEDSKNALVYKHCHWSA